MADRQQIDNRQMLTGLRHHCFIGGNDEEHRINTTHTGEHVLDKTLVSGDIDQTHFPPTRQGQPGKSQIDGHLALLLFAQTVGINTG